MLMVAFAHSHFIKCYVNTLKKLMCHDTLKEVFNHSDITMQNKENEYLAEDYNEVSYFENLTKESVAKESVFVAYCRRVWCFTGSIRIFDVSAIF